MAYSSAFSPSFKASTFTTQAIPGINYKVANSFNLSNIDFNKRPNINIADAFSGRFDFSSFINGTSWTFITAPADVSWNTNNAATRVDMFGTNNPPVVSGTKGMRDLRLGNALVEGFGRNVSVQGKVSALENLMNYKLNPTAGFVNVPVYQVKVSDKAYGEQGYFVFKSVTVKETMRDLRGDSTRAYVDIEMMQVPAFQVDSGMDQASSAITGAKPKAAGAAGQLAQVGAGAKPRAGAGASLPRR